MDTERPYDIFVSYNSADCDAVESVCQLLRGRGLAVFLDRWYLTVGRPWPEELERHLGNCRSVAVVVGAQGMGRWQHREYQLAIDRQLREPSFLVIPVLLPKADPPLGFLSLYTWVDLRSGIDETGVAPLVAALGRPQTAGDDDPSRRAHESVCPYRGLRVFREEDAAFFCGREEFVGKLVKACSDRRFVAVVGASGSGKSSVVRAGLIPELRRGHREVTWDIATMVPGDRPFYALAALLVPLLEPELTDIARLRKMGQLAEDLLSGRVQIRDAIAAALQRQPGTNRMLLVVDQWEELYTLTEDDEARRRYIGGLIEATAAPGGLSVVATLRADFYDEILNDRPLADRLDGGVVTVSRMSPAEVRRVIEEPAGKAGLRFEPGLVRRLLDATQKESESLPLLEFVLMELWKHRQAGGLLTHSAYEAIGELRGAIALHADNAFATLTASEQQVARHVFLHVVRPSDRAASSDTEAAEPTRRRTTFREVGAEKAAVVRRLADSHLLVTGRDDAGGEEFIDLVHEALIQAWEPLRGWIVAEETFLKWRDQLRTLMALSDSPRATATALLRGSLLSEAEEKLRTRPVDLSTSERRYIEENVAAARAERNRLVAWTAVAATTVLVALVALVLQLVASRKTPTSVDNPPLAVTASPAPGDTPDASPQVGAIDDRNVMVPAQPLTNPVAFQTLSKRVIVYLDLSGSMRPAETESPFSTIAEALQLLLDEPQFVSDQDEVLFLFFGDQVAAHFQWPFGSPRSTLVTALRKEALDVMRGRVAQRTDLDDVLANLTGQLSQKRRFNRQVIIVASDFVHEPGRIGPAVRRDDNSAFWSGAIDDWQRGWPSARQRLLPLLGDIDRNPFVLIDAPPVGLADGARRVRAEVLKDLETIPGAERLDLRAGGLDAAALAGRLRRRLYFPLKVVARTNLADRVLEVSVENPNGAAVTVERLELTCRSADGRAAGDPASLSFEGTELARPVVAQSRVNARVALGSQPCLDDAAKVEVRVATLEGAAGVGEREISWIDPQSIVSSAIEGNLLFRGSVLRLVVMLRAEAAPGDSFLITVSRQGSEGATVAEGSFSPPASLESFRARPYLFVFQLPEEARERLSGRQLEVRIAAARELRTEPRNDVSRSRVNGLQGAVGSVSLLAFMLTAWDGFRQRKQLHGDLVRTFQIQRFYEWILVLLVAVLNLVHYIFKPELLEHFRFASSAQPLMVAVGAAVVGFAVVRWRTSRSLVEAAQAKTPPPESLFEPRDWWRPWILALLLFLLGFGVTQLAPKGEQAEAIPVTMAEAGG